jgi:exoribonuclease II
MTSPTHAASLQAIARRAMLKYGLEPDWPADARHELAALPPEPATAGSDLTGLPWSSIDNDDSRDLDQLEVCIDGPSPRLLIAIADVDALVRRGSALDAHAQTNTTSVYTPAKIFPMLPPELSTNRTSLNEQAERSAVVVDMTIDKDGAIAPCDVYPARVCNHARLTYGSISAWLEGGPIPAPLERSQMLAAQLRLQDTLAARLRARRYEEGALDFDRTELKPILVEDQIVELRAETSNRARDLIESFMVAANGVTARFLSARGFASIRRVVRSPDRWPRIIDVAARYGTTLPPQPDAFALEQFLKTQQAGHPDEFADLSLTIIKLLGRGEYAAEPAGGRTGRPLCPRGDQLHPLDGSESPLPGFDYTASAEGGHGPDGRAVLVR